MIGTDTAVTLRQADHTLRRQDTRQHLRGHGGTVAGQQDRSSRIRRILCQSMPQLHHGQCAIRTQTARLTVPHFKQCIEHLLAAGIHDRAKQATRRGGKLNPILRQRLRRGYTDAGDTPPKGEPFHGSRTDAHTGKGAGTDRAGEQSDIPHLPSCCPQNSLDHREQRFGMCVSGANRTFGDQHPILTQCDRTGQRRGIQRQNQHMGSPFTHTDRVRRSGCAASFPMRTSTRSAGRASGIFSLHSQRHMPRSR